MPMTEEEAARLPLLPAPKPFWHCQDCRALVSAYRWSPLWCPPCDLARVNRISASLEDMVRRMEGRG